MTDPILTLPEVSILLKVAESTVYTMAQTGQIPAFKVRANGDSSTTISIGGSTNRRQW
ncbi:helix-turn-helix transcriptional regulator [Paracoccus zhejiangensis]|uniref:helix-turn-helix transcriptional regulator n=1 Tax=Paracoccus zhejiangensis TaxID=1077935 RepID=UPI001E357541|nr:helix-turn-helix domain-containing protein [Paracoccus zhejiangensis]